MSGNDPKETDPAELLDDSLALSAKVGQMLSTPAALLLPALARECLRDLAYMQNRLAVEIVKCSSQLRQ